MNRNNKYTELLKKEFKKYIVPSITESMVKYCKPASYKLQPQQLFLENLLKSNTNPWLNNKNTRGILLYHGIGSGKTCTAIRIAEALKLKLKIMVILPASVIENFQYELMSECTGNEYISTYNRKLLYSILPTDNRYKEIVLSSLKKIKKYYTIYSYHKFISLIQTNKLKNLDNHLLIIDEVQNMISIDGYFYNNLNKIISNSEKNLYLILLSATPIFDKPLEIALTLNLLKKKDYFNIENFNQDYIKAYKFNNKIVYKLINIENFKKKCQYLISYYRGAPPQSYPEMIFKLVKCEMSKFQYTSYISNYKATHNKTIKNKELDVDIYNLSNNFFLGSRILSNIAFPNRLTGSKGFKSLRKSDFQQDNIKKYSIKFYKIYKYIKQCKGLVFIYSNFKDYGGIRSFTKFLEYNYWKNHKTKGIGTKTFAIWDSSSSMKYRNEIKNIFNKKENIYGSMIKLLIGSPSIKEGVSLLRVRQIHILEPYWNIARLLQIIGRGVRFCSHKDLPSAERNVRVFLYIATHEKEQTIDNYIWNIAKAKYNLINSLEQALKESAFDCSILYNRNYYKSDSKKLICDSY